MDGFINLNKPAGWTSHDCVARVRRLLHMKRVGHGGTLDPAAIGVLPIALGRATRLLQYLPDDKAYLATIRFGVRTTTDDLDGEILTSAPCAELTLDHVNTWLPTFQGCIQQIPPKYSAIQVGGKRLYELARAGLDVTVPVRTVNVHEIVVQDWRSGAFPELDVAIACGSGTYIRAIARDLGEKVGVGATLSRLIRTHSSGFTLATSTTLDTLKTQTENSSFQPIAAQQALQHLPNITLSPVQEAAWLNGRAITAIASPNLMNNISEPSNLSAPNSNPVFVRVCSATTPFLGIGHWHPSLDITKPTLPQDSNPALYPKVVFN